MLPQMMVNAFNILVWLKEGEGLEQAASGFTCVEDLTGTFISRYLHDQGIW